MEKEILVCQAAIVSVGCSETGLLQTEPGQAVSVLRVWADCKLHQPMVTTHWPGQWSPDLSYASSFPGQTRCVRG